MTAVQVLTRETAIPNLTAPTGRVYALKPFEPNPSLLEIQYADGKGGPLPQELVNQKFTKREIGEAVIKKYLVEFWDLSDSKKTK